MYPFYNNAQAFPLFPVIPFARGGRTRVRTLDNRGIYEVCTTGIIENTQIEDGTVDYGISPSVWKALPNECVILWKVRHPVTPDGADLPATVVVPTGSSSTTVQSSGSTTGTKKVSVVDNKSTHAVGRDVTVPTGDGSNDQYGYTTEHMVYVNKCSDIFRLLGVTSQNSPARSTTADGGDTPAA